VCHSYRLRFIFLSDHFYLRHGRYSRAYRSAICRWFGNKSPRPSFGQNLGRYVLEQDTWDTFLDSRNRMKWSCDRWQFGRSNDLVILVYVTNFLMKRPVLFSVEIWKWNTLLTQSPSLTDITQCCHCRIMS
jgi:hypothetical protein